MRRYNFGGIAPLQYRCDNGDFVLYEDVKPFKEFAELVWANKWAIPSWMKDEVSRLLAREGRE